MSEPARHVEGLLFDLDGTVYQEGRAIPGAAETLETLRRRGLRSGPRPSRSPRALRW